jgi:hypothetical protein
LTGHLKSWAVEGSDDGAMWTEIDRRENNIDLNDKDALKMFAVARDVCFRMIRLRQTDPNHYDHNDLLLSAFEVFGAVARLEQIVSVKCFLCHLRETGTRRKAAQAQHCAIPPACRRSESSVIRSAVCRTQLCEYFPNKRETSRPGPR